MHFVRLVASLLVVLTAGTTVGAADGNRLTYLDESEPYHVSLTFPRLVTPQWVGEEGVEAVVVLAIDDMRGHEKWEAYLRPILQRLKKIDGRAPVSIMTNRIDPQDPHLQQWLKEGVSLETHTYDHPCPLFKDNDFFKAKETYERCVDLLASVPGSRPVAFRMPCCDSMNTPSPRFYAELFNKTTSRGNFLTIDTSVFNIITSNDPTLPRELVLDPDGRDKFRKYVPADRSFVNTIEDYPYPYVINRLCWEFPCVTPSDWQANHLHQPNNPATVRDWKAALDATVLKQGSFNLVFHPHGWIRNEQIIDLIDHAVARHGKKVKFLTFREAQERVNKHLLDGNPLRAANGQDNGVRLLDLNNDGYMDVVIGNDRVRQTRLWSPKVQTWKAGEFPTSLITVKEDKYLDAGGRFGIIRPDGHVSLLVRNDVMAGAWHFDQGKWVADPDLLAGLEVERQPLYTSHNGRDGGVRLRDLDGDGCCELIVGSEQAQAVFARSKEKKAWTKAPFTLPAGTSIADAEGKDAGLRFVDVDEDGHDDVLFSNDSHYSLHLFTSMEKGWGQEVLSGQRSDRDKNALPMVVRGGTNNGAWFHSRHLWVQNENTALLKDLVERFSYNGLLTNVEPPAKSAEASLRCMRARPGFQVELVAAEPLVQDPIAFDWGPDGKLWVVEMGDYPLGVDGKGKPGGRVRFLEDTDGDGKYDKTTVFLDGLGFPTGVMAWRKGVLVTCAPEIFYAEDTDDDGKADVRRQLYAGFREGNQQHRLNSLSWGLDNWIHGANGDSGGLVRSVKTGKLVLMRSHDFRIRPDEGALDLQTGQTQFGRCRDDWDNWFGCNNTNPMYHFVLADQYLRRNQHITVPQLQVQVSVTPGASRVFPISRTLPRFNSPGGANHFTSACSAIVYRDDLFGPGFEGNAFISEPVHNLVHREVMRPEGVTFKSQRALDEEESEFLASSDNWCRPTTIKTGPDGALWVADMYRHVIEHPEWIPKDWQQRLDLRAGHDKGRIYRVYPVGKPPRPIPRLDRLDSAGLVAALDSPNGWQRDMAQQMLIHRQDKAAVPLLEKAAGESKRALCRLHALCTLDGLMALRPAVLRQALADTHPGVRRHAVRLCESHLASNPDLGAALVKLVSDADAQVRLQLAYTLGEWDDPQAGLALGQLAVQAEGDQYFTTAVMSSVTKKNLDAVLLSVLAGSQAKPPPAGLVERLFRLAHALGKTQAQANLLAVVASPEKGNYAPWQFSALAGLLDTLEQQNTSLAELAKKDDPELRDSLKRLQDLFAAARGIVAGKKGSTTEKVAAMQVLGRGLDRQGEDIKMLADLLVPQSAEEMQAGAITALGRVNSPDVPGVLLAAWKGYGPSLRTQVLDILLRRQDWVKAVLDAMERKEVLPFEIDAARRLRLLTHKETNLRDRAAKLLAGAIDSDRQKVVEAYQSALSLKGDPSRGVQLFTKHCASCHRLAGIGQEVGPDLASLGDKSPESLLVAVFDPSRAVEARYINYLATTRNGLTLTGVLASEAGNSITLIGQDGKAQTVLRTDLEELNSTGKSAMPEGLEKDLKPQDVADLMAHIRSTGPQVPRKTFEGNKPEVVRLGKEGALGLLASNCEIYGPAIVLEKKHANLGYWSSENDHAIWSVEVPWSGKYAVWLDWACADSAAGNAFLFQAGSQRVTGKVEGTGNWDTYRQAKVGEVTLPVGRHQVTFRSAGKISGALLDLKEIKLVPIFK